MSNDDKKADDNKKADKKKKKDDDKFNIEHILKNWPFDPFSVNVRLLKDATREFLQMRVDMGILQLEIEGRPDGKRPEGANSYYDMLKKNACDDASFELKDDDCIEIDREFVQYYHRRVCWLQLKEFGRAVADADHTLGLMDFCKQFSPDEEWTISHEQYRPFVMYHRTQAAALNLLESGNDESAVAAIAEVDKGLDKLRSLFEQYDAEEQFQEDELVQRLVEFREGLRERFDIGDTLATRLDAAIAEEDYELAADLRDQIAAGANEVAGNSEVLDGIVDRNSASHISADPEHDSEEDDVDAIESDSVTDSMLDEIDDLDLEINDEE